MVDWPGSPDVVGALPERVKPPKRSRLIGDTDDTPVTPYRHGETPSTYLPPIQPTAFVPQPTEGLTASQKIDAHGIDVIIEMIHQGVSTKTMAEYIGVSAGSVVAWTGRPEYSARVWEARQKCAAMWEEKAEQTLQEASGEVGTVGFAITRATALAHHYRWRAGSLRKDRYGPQAPTVTTTINVLTPELQAARSRLVADLDTLAQPEPLTIEGRAEPAEAPQEGGALSRVKAPDRWE
jgi:hypothetical protein